MNDFKNANRKFIPLIAVLAAAKSESLRGTLIWIVVAFLYLLMNEMRKQK